MLKYSETDGEIREYNFALSVGEVSESRVLERKKVQTLVHLDEGARKWRIR